MINQALSKYPRLPDFMQLMRLDKPIGIYLLLWPTLWGLWLAGEGQPSLRLIIVFSLGVAVMRSAGCVINDIADRKIDGEVARTQDRPIAAGRIDAVEGAFVFFMLMICALILVLFTNKFTIYLSFGGGALAALYPFMKRHTYLPQVVLGAAFAWAIPMAFAAQTGEIPHTAWLIYFTVLLWTVGYDTAYAMCDKEDDIKIGVKSTAILFGDNDKMMIGIFQALTLAGLYMMGGKFELSTVYFLSLIPVAGLFWYQQILLATGINNNYLLAFKNNHWVGASVFCGIYLHYILL